jgi:hypothetical protein
LGVVDEHHDFSGKQTQMMMNYSGFGWQSLERSLEIRDEEILRKKGKKEPEVVLIGADHNPDYSL